MKWLNDNKVLRNFFTAIVWLVAYGAAIVWFGLFKDLDLDTVVLLDTGALTIIGFFAVKSLRWDITGRAFIDENVNNDDLKEINEGIVVENKKIKDDILGQEYVDKHNKIKQDKANNLLTTYKLGKLRSKLRKMRIRTKPRWFKRLFIKQKNFKDYQKKIVDRYVEQIALLEKNPLFDKKHKILDYNDVINVGELIIKKKMTEQQQINYNPKKDAWWSWFFSIFKFVGIGSTSIPFAINRQDWTILGAFYIALTITALITVIRRYLGIRKRTAGPYMAARKFKWNLMKKINIYINEKEAELIIKQNKEVSDKASILRRDTDVVFVMDGSAYSVHRQDFVNMMESPGKYGFGDTYEEAYQHMLEEEQVEIKVSAFLKTVNAYFKENDKDFVHESTKSEVKYLEVRLVSEGYEVRVVTDTFDRNPPIIRVKNKKPKEAK